MKLVRKYSLLERYGMLRSRISIIAEDLTIKSNIPINLRWKLLMKGFFSWHYTLYDLKNNDIKYYLSEYKRRKTRFINRKAAYILSDKLICDQILRQYVRTANIYGIIFKGIIYSIHNNVPMTSIKDIMAYLENIGPLVLKPNSGTDGGKGVIVVQIINGTIISNGREVNMDEFTQLIESLNSYIICEYIKQGKYGDSLFSETVNSIRILTMLSPEDNKPFIGATVQRIGTKESSPVDNWAAGGLSAYIDIATGVLSEAVSFKDGVLRYHETHPDTGKQIKGISVPNWEGVKNKILYLASKLPYLPYIAWDVVLLDDEILVIEANNCSDVSFLQAQEPLLKDEKVRRFYEYHGII